MERKPKIKAVASAFRGGKELNKTWNYEVSSDAVRDWLDLINAAAATVHYRADNYLGCWEVHVRANSKT